jgi:hypothetical protein
MSDRRRERSAGRSKGPGRQGHGHGHGLGVADHVLGGPTVRRDAVARARDLLRDQRWCRAEEVASTLVDCLVGGRMP